MKIGLLSICAMMFMLYGTDCRADRNAEDSEALQEVKSESFKPVFAKNRRNSLKNEKRKDAKKSKQDVSNSKESDGEFYDAVDPEYNAWLEKKNRDEKNSAESQANKNSWHRDGRSYADVVKGVKKQDEVNREELAESIKDKDFEQRIKDAKIKRGSVDEKRRFFEKNDEKKAEGDEKEFNKRRRLSKEEFDKLREKGLVRGNRAKFESKKEEKANDTVEKTVADTTQDASKKEQSVENTHKKIAPSQTSRSKKAYEARRAKQNAANQDEFNEKWKSANKSSNYVR